MQEINPIDNCKISIILPTYNGEQYLAQSIESCLKQTFKNFELIVVNDCSTDGTAKIIEKYAKSDSRIRIIHNFENKKLPASLNIGHNNALGEFITWTSDDNIYLPNALEKLLTTLQQEDADIVYSDVNLIDSSGEKIREINFRDFENNIFGNFIGSSFLYKRDVYERNKGYDENLFLIEDYDFWLRAIFHSKYIHIKDKLYCYRTHSNSLTNQVYSDETKNQLFSKNVYSMYLNFCRKVMNQECEDLTEFLSKNLTYQKFPFDSLIVLRSKLNAFKSNLFSNQNFTSYKALEKVFLKKTIEVMVNDQASKSNLKKSAYIIKEYARVLEKNDIKTLIKLSFFK